MPRETHLLNEAYDKVRKQFVAKKSKEGKPKEAKKKEDKEVQTEAHFGLPPHLKREMDAYLEGDPNVHVDFFDDWVHEFLSSVGFPEAEEYKPEIYEYLKKGGHLVGDEPEHIRLARQTGRMRSGGGRFQSLYGG
jgi:hypothetical protein